MKVLCDANIGSIIAQALRAEGHEVSRAVHVLPGAQDEDILAYASVHEHVLVTCDSDFGDLVFFRGHASPTAIIYIRFEPQDVADIVPRLLAILDFEALKGHMTVIGDTAIRRRPFDRKMPDHG